MDKDTGIQLQRIDSTFYAGYNFGSFPFVYHDSIYSLGGYGIWHINGQLRVYIPQAHSWDIVSLNEEIPVLMQDEHQDLLWYNEQEAKLYIGYSMVRNQGVKHAALNETAFDYTVRFLDLKTKDWHKAGALNDYFKDRIALLRNIAFTPWGQLVTFGNKLLLIDYDNNRLLRMRQRVEDATRPILFQHPNTDLYYCVDSTLSYGNIAKNELSSLTLHRHDFVDAGVAVYTAPVSQVLVILGWITGVPALSALFFALWRKRKRNVIKKIEVSETNNRTVINNAAPKELVLPEEQEFPEEETVNVLPTAKPSLYFEERELQVVQLILNNNRQSILTTIDDVNAVLGVSRKSIDAQKNYRSQVLKSINTKYRLLQQTSDKLIESKKAETDKRTFVYCIAPDKEAAIAGLLNVTT